MWDNSYVTQFDSAMIQPLCNAYVFQNILYAITILLNKKIKVTDAPPEPLASIPEGLGPGAASQRRGTLEGCCRWIQCLDLWLSHILLFFIWPSSGSKHLGSKPVDRRMEVSCIPFSPSPSLFFLKKRCITTKVKKQINIKKISIVQGQRNMTSQLIPEDW